MKGVVSRSDERSRIGDALYFSRAPIPHDRDGGGGAPWLRHVGIYAHRARELAAYAGLAEMPLRASDPSL